MNQTTCRLQINTETGLDNMNLKVWYNSKHEKGDDNEQWSYKE